MPPPPASTVAPSNRWRSLRGLTTALTILFALTAAASVFGMVAFLTRVGVANDILDGGIGLGLALRAADADDLVAAAAGIMITLTVALAVLMIIWTWRASKNNEALGRFGPRLSPEWAIAGWLIPLANFVLPVLVLQDIWRGSDRGVPRHDPHWRSARGSALIGWYWTAFVLSAARFGLGRTDARLGIPSQLRDLRTHDIIGAAGMGASAVAAVLALVMVRRIASRQDECLTDQQAAWTS